MVETVKRSLVGLENLFFLELIFRDLKLRKLAQTKAFMNIATFGKKLGMVWPVLGILGNLSSGFF